MLKLPRYTLAAIFLAASVGCLGLWGWTASQQGTRLAITYPDASRTVNFIANEGFAFVGLGHPLTPRQTARGMQFAAVKTNKLELRDLHAWLRDHGSFGYGNRAIAFPLWYPALVFALAAVGVLRLGKPFTIRSALIATAVVAALLGMVVAL